MCPTEAFRVLLNTLKKRDVYGRYKALGIGVFLTEELMEGLWLLTNCGSERRKVRDGGHKEKEEINEINKHTKGFSHHVSQEHDVYH